MRFDLLQIGSPININTLYKVIESVDGVESIITNKKSIITSKSEEDKFFDQEFLTTRTYNKNVFNPQITYNDGFIYPSRGGIFEMRYTAKDIVIIAN